MRVLKHPLITGATLILGVGVLIFIPSFIRARSTPSTNACVNTLRQIEGAQQQWTVDNLKGDAATPTWDDIRSYIGRDPHREMPTCPQGGVYTLGRVGEPPRCSIGPPHHLLE